MRVMIFGGTSEGRSLFAELAGLGLDVTLSVATDYGRAVAIEHEPAPDRPNAQIISARLSAAQMADLFASQAFDYVVDATHPYAAEVTANIQGACQASGRRYLRLKRPESPPTEGVAYVASAAEAVGLLNQNSQKALLTVGSKDLEAFTQVNGYHERLYVRILPMPESLAKALRLGYSASQVICMQGPFSKEMNVATLQMTGAKTLVTKESGDAGGFAAKVSAAQKADVQVIVVARPLHEEGYSPQELVQICQESPEKKEETV
ncbi:MAG: precorrin-6A reductase [Coriobacteriia bacterium]|nr:precorrin-6A reductase [Coriobacteriia bacterium]